MSIRLLTAVALLPVALAGFAPLLAQGRGGQQVQLPDGNGRDLVQTTCAKCHGLNLITNSFGYTREGWQGLFNTMVALPGDQAAAVASYLRPEAVSFLRIRLSFCCCRVGPRGLWRCSPRT